MKKVSIIRSCSENMRASITYGVGIKVKPPKSKHCMEHVRLTTNIFGV